MRSFLASIVTMFRRVSAALWSVLSFLLSLVKLPFHVTVDFVYALGNWLVSTSKLGWASTKVFASLVGVFLVYLAASYTAMAIMACLMIGVSVLLGNATLVTTTQVADGNLGAPSPTDALAALHNERVIAAA